MVGIKVFVGNLSFKTTEAELADAFKASGKLVTAHIITTPSNRSKGYGFVEFESQGDAEKAVAAMNKKDLGGRPINVELARPQEAKPVTTTTSAPTDETDKPRRPRRTAPRRTNTRTDGKQGEKAPAPKKESSTNGKSEVTDSDKPRPQRRPRAPRKYQERRKAEPTDKTPSKTMLFVANLAWKVTDESFTSFLKTEGIKFKSANVVMTKSGRSRGYGFVNCDNTDEQTRAMDILNKKELDGRNLNAKVANASSETPRTSATPAPETK